MDISVKKPDNRLGRSRLPLSMQIGSLLRRRLEEGEWKVGQQLPTLEDFMAEYGVSRATMRAALSDLESEGLIERGRGRGTFVTEDIGNERWLILPTDWDGLVNHIDDLHARVETLESGPGDPRISPSEGTLAKAYWSAKRVNWTAHAPYSLTVLYLEQTIFRKHRREFESRPIVPLLGTRFPESIAEATQVLTISSADLDTAKHLQLSVGTPIVQVRRVVRDHEGRVIYLAIVLYPAKHLRIETDMRPPRRRAA